jgi:hypothetical protein
MLVLDKLYSAFLSLLITLPIFWVGLIVASLVLLPITTIIVFLSIIF